MNTKKKYSILAVTAALAILAGSAVTATANADDGPKISVPFTVTNVPLTITDAEKIADRLIGIVCPVDPASASAPVTIPCADSNSRIEIDDDNVSLSNGTLTGTFEVDVPAAPVTYATYLQLKASTSLGYAVASTSAGVLMPLDATSTSTNASLSFALPTPGAVSYGTSNRGREVRVNLTVTNVPASVNKASKLEDAVRVCIIPLAADATTVTNPTITSCPSNTAEVKASSLVNGVWSGTVKIKRPRESGASANYALYVSIRAKRDLALASQFGAGQFVTVTNDAGVAKVTAGLDGLTLDMALNSGSGAIAKVIPVVVPDDGNSYAVLITRIESSKERAVAYVPVKVGDTSVAIPGDLKGGNYRAQLIVLSTGDLFTLDSKKFLDDEVKSLTHGNN